MMIEYIFIHKKQKVQCEIYCKPNICKVSDMITIRGFSNRYAERLESFTLLMSPFFSEGYLTL